MGLSNLFGLFGKPQMGGDTDGLEGNFDKAFAPKQEGLNIDPKLAMLSQIFANMGGKDSPVFQYSMAMQGQRRKQQEAEEERRARVNEWIQQQQWKRDHPEPAAPPPEQRLVEWLGSLAPEKRAQAVQMLDMARPKVIGDPVSGYNFAPRPQGGTQPPASGPAPGTVHDGYRFRGGNPNDPNAWEQLGGPVQQAPATFP